MYKKTNGSQVFVPEVPRQCVFPSAVIAQGCCSSTYTKGLGDLATVQACVTVGKKSGDLVHSPHILEGELLVFVKVNQGEFSSHLAKAPLHCLPHGTHLAVKASFVGLQGRPSAWLHQEWPQWIRWIAINDQPLALRRFLKLLVEAGILKDTCKNADNCKQQFPCNSHLGSTFTVDFKTRFLWTRVFEPGCLDLQ